MPVRIPADADLNTLRTPGFYWCDGATNANRPDDSGSFCLLIEKTGSWAGNGVKQTFTNYDSGAIYTRVSPKDIWKPWRLLATATPPQEFDLPLAEGVTPVTSFKNSYSKDQFGIVRVWFSVRFESIPEVNAPVFTLPEGFRPDSVCDNAATLSMGAHYPALLSISASGIAIVSHGAIEQAGAINLHGYIEFPAAS